MKVYIFLVKKRLIIYYNLISSCRLFWHVSSAISPTCCPTSLSLVFRVFCDTQFIFKAAKRVFTWVLPYPPYTITTAYFVLTHTVLPFPALCLLPVGTSLSTPQSLKLHLMSNTCARPYSSSPPHNWSGCPHNLQPFSPSASVSSSTTRLPTRH